MPEVQKRLVSYRMYPNTSQKKALMKLLECHCFIYNWARSHLIEADEQGKSLSYADLCKLWTSYKQTNPEFKMVGAQSAQETIQRACISFETYRRKKRKGENPGYPRVKQLNRIKGWGYKTHGDGNRIISDGHHGKVRIGNMGLIKIRGQARTVGEVKTVGIKHKNGKWYTSVVYICEPTRVHGDQQIGFDCGLETYVTKAYNDGTHRAEANPRFYREVAEHIKIASKNLSRKQPGSKNWMKAAHSLALLYEKLENQRNDFVHQISADLVKEASFLATEELGIQQMVVKGGPFNTSLNKSIYDAAWARLIKKVGYKAEEAGIPFVLIPTKIVKPSQTCPQCGKQEKKALFERMHECDCGLRLSRDQAAARVILNWALCKNSTGREPALCGESALALSVKHEICDNAPK